MMIPDISTMEFILFPDLPIQVNCHWEVPHRGNNSATLRMAVYIERDLLESSVAVAVDTR